MSVALWCVLIAGLLPYVATVIAKAGAPFDNRDPRARAECTLQINYHRAGLFA